MKTHHLSLVALLCVAAVALSVPSSTFAQDDPGGITLDQTVGKLASNAKTYVQRKAGARGGWGYRVGNYAPRLYGCELVGHWSGTCPVVYRWTTRTGRWTHCKGTAKATLHHDGRWTVRRPAACPR